MPTAELSQLPNDLILVVSDFLSEADVNALAQTSRRFYDVLNHFLYSKSVREKEGVVLTWAVHYNRVGALKKALAAGADANYTRPLVGRLAPNNPGRNFFSSMVLRNVSSTPPLTLAASCGQLELASVLIDAGAKVDVELTDANPETPLLAAVEANRLAMIKFLLDTEKVDIDSLCKYNRSILSIAVRCCAAEAVRFILNAIQNVELHNSIPSSPLSSAIIYRRPDIARLLIDSGKVDITIRDNSGRTAFAWAAAMGDEDMVQLLLQRKEVDVNSTDDKGHTPISHAAYHGKCHIVQLLLDTPNVDPNLPTGNLAPIILALQAQQIETVQALLQSERVHIPVNTLFRIACEKSSTVIIKELLRMNHADKHMTDEQGNTWLHSVAMHGRIDAVRFFLHRNYIDVDTKRHDGATPLMCAIQTKRKAAANALLQAGADIHVADARGWTALCYAADRGSYPLAEELIKKGADARQITTERGTALHLACRVGETKVAQLLLDSGADPLQATDNGDTPLHVACSKRWDQTVQLLLTKIPPSHPILRTGRTPLHEACLAGHTGIVKNLIDHGSDAALPLENGTTPLRIACQGNPMIAKMLINKGADPVEVGPDGVTLLHIACHARSSKVASILLKHGADANALNNDGRTPLHEACRQGGGWMLLSALLKHGAQLGAVTPDGSTPLHEACFVRYVASEEITKSITFLIENGADIHARDHINYTPLHTACTSGNLSAISTLLEHGADPLAEALESETGCRITPIHIECRSNTGSLILEELLDAVNRPLNEIWAEGRTPLHDAAAALGHVNVGLLIDRGLNPMALTETGRTALHETLLQNFETSRRTMAAREILKLLIGTGKMDLEHRDGNGQTAVEAAGELPDDLVSILKLSGAVMQEPDV